MRLIAVVTTVLLGASPSLFAQPNHGYGHHREAAMLVDHVRFEGKGNVKVTFDGQRVRTIELQALRGEARITRATVQYRDGSHGEVRIDQRLDAGRGASVRVELGRSGMRGVDSIVFWGHGDAAFRVVGLD